MMGCKPSSIPMMHNTKLHISYRDPLPDRGSYRHLIGRLLYLTIYIHANCFTNHKLSQFLSKLFSDYLSATHFLFRYLKHVAKVYYLNLILTFFTCICGF